VTDLLRPRVSITESYEPSDRQRISALSETNRAVTAENVALNLALDGLQRAHAELERRVLRVREACERRFGDAFARRLLRYLEGED